MPRMNGFCFERLVLHHEQFGIRPFSQKLLFPLKILYEDTQRDLITPFVDWFQKNGIGITVHQDGF